MATPTDERPIADVVEDELALVDSAFRRAFGQHMATWDAETRTLFNDALAEVYAQYTAEQVIPC